MRQHLFEAIRVLGQPVARQQVFLHEDAQHGREQPRVAARLHLQVDVGQVGGLRAARIDDDEAALGVARDLAQRHAGAREAVRVPGVLADEHTHLAVLEVAPRVASQHAAAHPELAGLLLRQRVGAIGGAEHGARGARVRGRQVVALPAAAVVEDRRAAVRVAERREALRHLADGGLPVDGLEAPVGPPAQRPAQPIGAVLVVVEARGLLAGVAPGRGMGLVAAHAGKAAAVLAAELDLDAAVALAQDAGRGMPGAGTRRRCGHGIPPACAAPSAPRPAGARPGVGIRSDGQGILETPVPSRNRVLPIGLGFPSSGVAAPRPTPAWSLR